MKRVAFLTLENRGDFYVYDSLLFAPLEALGWHAEEVSWSRPGVPWDQYDAVVIRSTWDYQGRPADFLKTLERIDSVSRLFNPLSVCRWNMNKRYLRDLQGQGVGIVPSLWLESLHRPALEESFATLGSERVVVKPQIGANADDTFVVTVQAPASWDAPLRVFAQKPLIIQPFVNAVLEEGEYSLFYFGGHYSHAIRKRPAPGDFRVQEEHGGQISSAEPSRSMRALASKALQAVDAPLLYARVDVILGDQGIPWLMELELIEPSLYFEQCTEAPERFARAFESMFANHS